MNGFIPDGIVMLDEFSIDMVEPNVVSITPSVDTVKREQSGPSGFSLTVNFDEAMHRWMQPNIELSQESNTSLTLNSNASGWINEQTFVANYDVSPDTWKWDNIEVSVTSTKDMAGNIHPIYSEQGVFSINVFPPLGVNEVFKEGSFVAYPNPVKIGSTLSVIISESPCQKRHLLWPILIGKTILPTLQVLTLIWIIFLQSTQVLERFLLFAYMIDQWTRFCLQRSHFLTRIRF